MQSFFNDIVWAKSVAWPAVGNTICYQCPPRDPWFLNCRI